MTTRILFVCLGNICRSPTAEGVFRHIMGTADIIVDSAGTSGWHQGEPPDRRATAEAAKRGIDLSIQRSRQMTAQDFAEFDLILAMDRSNLADLEAMRPVGNTTPVRLFLSSAPGLGRDEVPDPYYEGGFDGVLDMIETASRAWLDQLGAQ